MFRGICEPTFSRFRDKRHDTDIEPRRISPTYLSVVPEKCGVCQAGRSTRFFHKASTALPAGQSSGSPSPIFAMKISVLG